MTALRVELLKLRRSAAARVAAGTIALAVPLLALGFVTAATQGGDSQLAVKVRPLLPGEGWIGLLGITGQVLTVALLLSTAFVVSWTFGREFADGTVEGLLLAGPPPAVLASAKLAAAWLWMSCACGAAVLATVGLGVVTGSGPLTDAVGPAARALTAGLLMVALALPVGLAASAGRSALAGVGAGIGLVVVTQLATLTGAGAWFPWAAPSLWTGMGGPSSVVSPVQLLLALPVAALGWAATCAWWERTEVVR